MTFLTEKEKPSSSRFMLVKLGVKYAVDSSSVIAGATYDVISWSGEDPTSLQYCYKGGSETVEEIDVSVTSLPTANDEFYYDKTNEVIYVLDRGTAGVGYFIRFPIYLTGEKLRYIGSNPTSPTTDVKEWLPYIDKYPSVSTTIRNVLQGITTQSISTITAVSNDYIARFFSDEYSFRNQLCEGWVCVNGVDNIQKAFGVTIDSVSVNNKKISFKLFNGLKDIDTIAFERYYDNNNRFTQPVLFGTKSTAKAIDVVGVNALFTHTAFGGNSTGGDPGTSNRQWILPATLTKTGSTAMATQVIGSVSSTSNDTAGPPRRIDVLLSSPHNLVQYETVKFNTSYYGYVWSISSDTFFTMAFFNSTDPTPTSFTTQNHPSILVEKDNFADINTSNRIFNISDGTIINVGLTVDVYNTGADLAANLQLRLNTFSSGYTVTYNAGLGRFTISRSPGTFTLNLSLTSGVCHQWFGFVDTTNLGPVSSASSQYPVFFGRNIFIPIGGVDFTTTQVAGDTVGDFTFYHPKITFGDNFEDSRGINYIVAGDVCHVGYRPKRQHTHADAIDDICQFIGYSTNTASLTQADSDIDSDVFFSVPHLDSTSWPTFKDPIERILKSTIGYVYENEDGEIVYGVVKPPVSGDVFDKSNIAVDTFSYKFELFDLTRYDNITNPYVGPNVNESTGTERSPATYTNATFQLQNFHEMKQGTRTFEHVLLDFDDVVENYLGITKYRRFIVSFDTIFEFYNKNVGDDITVDGELLPDGNDINFKITSITKRVDKVLIEAEAFEGFV